MTTTRTTPAERRGDRSNLALNSTLQDDFSAGIVRSVEGQRIPRNGVYDCVNGLLDDDLGIYRRGGSSYESTANAGSALVGLADVQLAGVNRTLMWSAGNIYRLDDSFGVVTGPTPSYPQALSRGVPYKGAYAFLDATGTVSSSNLILALWGGATIANYNTGTTTLTQGSADVSGAGTSWVGNVEPGMMVLTNLGFGVVKTVVSNTSLRLVDPWPDATVSGVLTWTRRQSVTLPPRPADARSYITAIAGRLLVGYGGRLDLSLRDTPSFPSDEFHQFPATITGLDAIRDSAVVFTTSGVWAVSNVAYDLTDAYGNPQQRVEQVSKNIILWDDSGVAAYRSALVVPALDDVYLLDLAGTEVALSGAIRPLYRSYVKAGYRPGTAAVHNNHYFLPIVNGTTWVDTLVCRLDGERPAWTRWADHGGSIAYAQRVGAATRTPELLCLQSERVVDLTNAFSPAAANKNDADGTSHVLTVVTRDYAARAQVKSLWKYLRARFELTDAGSDNPTLTAEYANGPPATESWTSMGSWSEGDGTEPSRLGVGRRTQSIRFRIKTSGASSKAVLRSLEVMFREGQRL